MTAPALAIPVGGLLLPADLTLPPMVRGLVVFAHGSGSSRLSPRNRLVAARLQQAGLGTLLFDLLSPEESRRDQAAAAPEFPLTLFGDRLLACLDWLASHPLLAGLFPVGLFGASSGAAVALQAAAMRQEAVAAVVSRGGRPDLAGDALGRVRAPTLLIVGGEDAAVLRLNRAVMPRLRCPHRLDVVPGAGHLFEEPGTLERAARLARDWFLDQLPHGSMALERPLPELSAPAGECHPGWPSPPLEI